MTRAPVCRHEVELGESVICIPPAGATRYLAWSRLDIMPAFDLNVAAETSYGGDPPRWQQIGGYDIAGGVVIKAGSDSVKWFSNLAAAGGVTVPWDKLVELASGVGTDALQVIAYDVGRVAFRRDIYAVPAPSATDAAVIAAQERRVLQSLLIARERAAGAGGIKRRDSGDGIGEEFESLAGLDRRIAEVRARIAWLEAAANGNILPRIRQHPSPERDVVA